MWLRRRRQIDKGLKERLEAEVHQRAAEEDGRLLARAVRVHVKGLPRLADDVERLAKVRVLFFADHLAGVRIVERRERDRRPILALRFALVAAQRLLADVVDAAKPFRAADGPV